MASVQAARGSYSLLMLDIGSRFDHAKRTFAFRIDVDRIPCRAFQTGKTISQIIYPNSFGKMFFRKCLSTHPE